MQDFIKKKTVFLKNKESMNTINIKKEIIRLMTITIVNFINNKHKVKVCKQTS